MIQKQKPTDRPKTDISDKDVRLNKAGKKQLFIQIRKLEKLETPGDISGPGTG